MSFLKSRKFIVIAVVVVVVVIAGLVISNQQNEQSKELFRYTVENIIARDVGEKYNVRESEVTAFCSYDGNNRYSCTYGIVSIGQHGFATVTINDKYEVIRENLNG